MMARDDVEVGMRLYTPVGIVPHVIQFVVKCIEPAEALGEYDVKGYSHSHMSDIEVSLDDCFNSFEAARDSV